MNIMTPEEILKYGKRVVLFPEAGSKSHKIYYVDGHTLVRHTILWTEGRPIDVYHSPCSIEDIYPHIERVYSRNTKGILIARRSGNRKQKHPAPLRKTGKGMGITLKKPKSINVYQQLELVEKIIQQNARIQHYATS